MANDSKTFEELNIGKYYMHIYHNIIIGELNIGTYHHRGYFLLIFHLVATIIGQYY